MRCYDGAPDSSLRAFLDDEAKARAALAAAGLSVTYFPGPPDEGIWVFDDLHIVSGPYSSNRAAADAVLSI